MNVRFLQLHGNWRLLASAVVVLLLALVDVPVALLAAFSLGCFALLDQLRVDESVALTVASALAGSLVILGVLVPAVVGIIDLVPGAYEDVFADDVDKAVAIILAILFLLIVWVTLAVRWKYSEIAFVAASLIFFGLMKLAYVMLVDLPPVSDFRSMLFIADGWVNNGMDGINGSAADQARGERVLLYLYPIRALFGTEGDNFQYVNVVVSCITALLSYFVAGQFFGRVAARVTLVAALLAIEPLQAAEIPTHDIPGALSVMSFIAVFVLVWRDRENGRAWLWAALLGVIMVWAGLQRSVSVVLQLGLLVYALLSIAMLMSSGSGRPAWRSGGRQLLLVIVVPMLVYSVLSISLSAAGMKRAESDVAERRMTLIVIHSESWGDGSYRYARNRDFNDSAPESYGFALKRLMSDTYYSPGSRIDHYLRKAGRLYDFGRQQGFYMPVKGVIQEEPVGAKHKKRARLANRVYAVAFLLFMIMGAGLSLIVWRESLERQFPLILLATLGGLLILFSEVQPRYAFPIWYIGSIYFGNFFSSLFRPVAEDVEVQS